MEISKSQIFFSVISRKREKIILWEVDIGWQEKKIVIGSYY